MTEHIYMLQTWDGKSYRRSTMWKVNALVMADKAEWAGVDGDEEADTVTYYADRI